MIAVRAATADHPIWLHVGTLLDGSGDAPVRDVHLVYDAAAIRFVGPGGRTPPPELVRRGQTTPDVVALDVTLLPGLIDAHTHLFLEGGELDLSKRAAYLKQSPGALLAAAEPRMAKLARLGFAGVRDAGDKDGVGLALSRACREQAGPTVRPYIDSPGAAIHHRGRYGGFMGGALEDHASPAACVAARVAAGADRIKLIPTGIINFQQGAVTAEPQMTLEELRECVGAAAGAGRQTLAHASGDAGIERVVESRVDSVEHGFFVRDDQLARMRDRRIAWVPTFAPVQVQVDEAARYNWDATVTGHLRRILEAHAASLLTAHRLGLSILAGSDAGSCGVPHGFGLLYELELMERAGLPAGAVLHAATGAPADRLAFGRKFGRIAPGWLSRFILTRHSPLATVANLRRTRTVVFDGQVFQTDENFDRFGL